MQFFLNTWKRLGSMAVLCLAVLLIARPGYGSEEEITPLWLSLAPTTFAPVAAECHPQEEDPAAAITEKPGPGSRPTTADGAGRSGRPGQDRGGARRGGRHESEHRPKPVRTYWLNTKKIAPGTETYVRHPDGTVEKASIKRAQGGLQVSFKLAMGDGPTHGGNTLYVVERQVREKTLYVRVAQWLTIHHNCGWGHDHKFDQARMNIQPLDQLPFQMVINDLWDGNFHSYIMAGQTVSVQTLVDNKPVADTKVRMVSEKGWSNTIKTDPSGSAEFQLIRDSFPDSWASFKRDKKNSFKLTASYEIEELGTYDGEDYERIHYISTFPWRYYPARTEYSSFAAGLGLTMLFAVGGGVGVYSHREKRKRPYREITLDE